MVSEEGPGKGAARQGVITSDNGTLAEVMPNPVKNVLQVQINDSKGQTFDLQFMDISGRLMQSKKIVAETNQHKETLDVTAQGAGMYFLKVVGATKSQTLKVLKID